MAQYEGTFSGRSQYKLRLTANQASQNITDNTSVVNWTLHIIESPNWGSFSGQAAPWSVNIGGHVYSGSISGYNFNNYDSLLVASGSTTIAHKPDGSQSITISASMTDPGPLKNASASGPLGLDTIPRASKPTFVGGSSFNPGSPITINMNRAAGTFTHTVEYTFGAVTEEIASGVATSVSWTPDMSLLHQIPNAASGVGNLIVKTYNGATLIGTTNTPFTLTVPSSVVPTFDTIVLSENVAAVATAIGGYVQGLSKLNFAITGAAGVYSSTIASYKLEVAGQTLLTQSGVTGVITTNGTVPVKATVTDSRGRAVSKTVNISVLALSTPQITSFSLERADAGGAPMDEGVYVRINIDASVSPLTVGGTPKNTLSFKVYTRKRGTTTWTLKDTVTPGGVSFSGQLLVGTYPVEEAFDVMVEVLDRYSTSSAVGQIATAEIFMHWGDGLGVGKYWERGTIDSIGQMYQNDGKKVVDEDSLGTAMVSGVSTIMDARGFYPRQVVYFTSSGNFTKASYPWLKAIRARVQAGGGGGAPANAVSPGGNTSFGTGGGGGGYAEKFITNMATVPTTTAVTVGAGGAGGLPASSSGGTGGNSSFGALVVATGGGGGATKPNSPYTAYVRGGIAGQGTAGDLLITGQGGTSGTGDTAGLCSSGGGGASHLGGGAATAGTGAGNGGEEGFSGGLYGGGGGGGSGNGGSSGRKGGNGAQGIVVLELYG